MRPGKHRSETGPTRDSDEAKALRLETAKDVATKMIEAEAKRLEKMGASKQQILEQSKRIDELADYLYHAHSNLLDRLAEQKRRTLDGMTEHARKAGSEVNLGALGKQALVKLGSEFKAFLSSSGNSETGQQPATDSSAAAEQKATKTSAEVTPAKEAAKAAPETRPLSDKKPAMSETAPVSTPKDGFNLGLLRDAAKSARMRAEVAASSLQPQVRDSTEAAKKGTHEGTRAPTRDASGQLSDACESPKRPEHSVLAESKIVSETDLQRAIGYHAELRLRKDFDMAYSDAVRYVQGRPDSGTKGEALERGLERLELRRTYESVHGGAPTVRIESMEDFKQLADTHRSLSSEDLWLCAKYFDLKDKCSQTQSELSKTERVPVGHIWKWRLGIEPVPIRDVRRDEEDRIISDWAARTDSSTVHDRFKADPEADSVRHSVRRLPTLSRPDVEGLCSACSQKALSPEKATAVVRDIIGKMQDTPSRVLCADLGDQSASAQSPLGAFRSVLHENRELVEKNLEGPPLSDGSVPCTRLAVVENRLYIWRPDSNPVSLINAYGSLYFYFKDDRAFTRLMEGVKESLDGDRTGGLHKTVSYAEKLIHEMLGDALLPRHVQDIYGRVRGEHLHLLLDLLDRPLKSLEGDISRVAAPNGHGGIASPKFPHGEELDVAIARLTGVVVTDCHLRKNGSITLGESEIGRIAIIERSLGSFGDIKLNPKWDDRSNSYTVNFPTVLGRILQHLGVPGGDRTVQNPGLPEAVFRFSWKAQCALVENIVPQDGTVSESAISWTHSNALHPAKKGERYGVDPVVGDSEIDFIKAHGKEDEVSWVLAVGNLRKMAESSRSEVAGTASQLLDKVYQNPNRLIEDGRNLTESIGVKMITVPYTVHYFKRTGRVSVSWGICTKNVGEAVKLSIAAPPDDQKKRQAAKHMLMRKPEEVNRALRWFAARGVNIEQWWTDE